MLALPPPPSWYPGHMAAFAKALPSLLPRTHVFLEVRDLRLPLTSINPQLESAIAQWRGNGRAAGKTCEHIVVYTKRDLVPSWGEERLRNSLRRHFDHKIHFTAPSHPASIRALHRTLVCLYSPIDPNISLRLIAGFGSLTTIAIAKENDEASNEINVLVAGMPNVGKSSLLNSLRRTGTSGSVSKRPMLTSAMPGHTKKLSNRLKLSQTHPIYAIDSPGVMIPFFGSGDDGKERGVKLAVAAGIKESLYDEETLASYLIHCLWRENPQRPAYGALIGPGVSTSLSSESTFKFLETLEAIALRMGAVRTGGDLDLSRAAWYVIRWWREGKHAHPALDSTSNPTTYVRGWGLDFYFNGSEVPLIPMSSSLSWDAEQSSHLSSDPVQAEMDHIVDVFVKSLREKTNGIGLSANQRKKREREEKRLERERKLNLRHLPIR